MAQRRSTKIISMIKWIRTSRLPIQNSISGGQRVDERLEGRSTVTGLSSSSLLLASLELSDTKVYEPEIQALLASRCCLRVGLVEAWASALLVLHPPLVARAMALGCITL